MKMETRNFCGPVSLRNDGKDGPKRITGLGAVFYDASNPDTEYNLWGNIYERMMPGCFDQTMRADDIRATYNHDFNQLLGRTKSNTLRLSIDSRGLNYEIEPANTRVYGDVLEMIERGDVDGSSVWMVVKSERWRIDESNDREIREIEEAQLIEVGPVADPAYKATTAGSRSNEMFAEARASYDGWKSAAAIAMEKIVRDQRKRNLKLIELGA